MTVHERGLRPFGESVLKLDSWMDYAACRGLAVDEGTFDTFFPKRQGQRNPKAKQLCAICPVRLSCLDFAIRNNIHEGTWGNTSERQRRKIKRELKRNSEQFLEEISPTVDAVAMAMAE